MNSAPTTPRPAHTRMLLCFVAFMVGLLVLTIADHWLWQHLRVARLADAGKPTPDWYQFLRGMGYLPVWLALGLAMFLHDSAASKTFTRAQQARGLLIMLSAALGGGAAELLKLLTHRLRPGETGEYLFRHFLNGLEGPGADQLRATGFGLASSHAGVAFGGAFMVARLFPRAAPMVLALAAGCGLTRLFSGAHFATDVYVAAGMGYAVAALLWRWTNQSDIGPRA